MTRTAIALAILLCSTGAASAGWVPPLPDGPIPEAPEQCVDANGQTMQCPETPEEAQARQKAAQQRQALQSFQAFQAKFRRDLRVSNPALAAQYDILDALEQLHQDNLDAAARQR